LSVRVHYHHPNMCNFRVVSKVSGIASYTGEAQYVIPLLLLYQKQIMERRKAIMTDIARTGTFITKDVFKLILDYYDDTYLANRYNENIWKDLVVSIEDWEGLKEAFVHGYPKMILTKRFGSSWDKQCYEEVRKFVLEEYSEEIEKQGLNLSVYHWKKMKRRDIFALARKLTGDTIESVGIPERWMKNVNAKFKTNKMDDTIMEKIENIFGRFKYTFVSKIDKKKVVLSGSKECK